jgi:hypothetical protein
MDQNYPQHKETFEVVLLKKGVSSLTAEPGDFKRIAIEAAAPGIALLDDKIMAEMDAFVPLFAAPPGVMTEPEIHARRREMEGPPVDRSKV